MKGLQVKEKAAYCIGFGSMPVLGGMVFADALSVPLVWLGATAVAVAVIAAAVVLPLQWRREAIARRNRHQNLQAYKGEPCHCTHGYHFGACHCGCPTYSP